MCGLFQFHGLGGIPGEKFREGMGKWRGEEDFPGLEELENELELENLLEMNGETYKKNIQPWFFYIGENEYWLWRANVLRAMANSGDIKYYDAINRHLTDKDERVHQIAAWGIRKLNLQV